MTRAAQDWVVLCPDGQRRAMRRPSEIEALAAAANASASAPAPCGATNSMADPPACPGGAHRAVYDPPKITASNLADNPAVARVLNVSGEAFVRAAMAGSRAHACAAEGARLGALYAQRQREAAPAPKAPAPRTACTCGTPPTLRDRLTWIVDRVRRRVHVMLGRPLTFRLLGPDGDRYTSAPLAMRLVPAACVGLSHERAIATVIRLRREGYPYELVVDPEQPGGIGLSFGHGVNPAELGYADDGTPRTTEAAHGHA